MPQNERIPVFILLMLHSLICICSVIFFIFIYLWKNCTELIPDYSSLIIYIINFTSVAAKKHTTRSQQQPKKREKESIHKWSIIFRHAHMFCMYFKLKYVWGSRDLMFVLSLLMLISRSCMCILAHFYRWFWFLEQFLWVLCF